MAWNTCCYVLSVVLTMAFSHRSSTTLPPKAFDGFQLLSLHPRSIQEVACLVELRQEHNELDFWQPPAAPTGSVVLVPPHLVNVVKSKVERMGIPWNVISKDIDSLIDAESPGSSKNRSRFTRSLHYDELIDHFMYKTYDQFNEDIRRLQKNYPENIHLEPLPHVTLEGREVMAVKVSGTMKNPTERLVRYAVAFAQRMCTLVFDALHNWFGNFVRALDRQEKAVIIVEGGIHAREWISPAAILYVIHTLVEKYNTSDPDALFMLDFYDWYFVPLANPDGYAYSHENRRNRFWRKNRRKIDANCTGVDLNRNFDFHFAMDGESEDCCSEIYSGENPWSEPESRNLRDLYEKLKSRLAGYLAIHSFGQFILVPWCYLLADSHPDNRNELTYMAKLMSQAIYQVQNKTYKAGTLFDILRDSATGTSIDWALHQKPGLFSYGYELRPSLKSGHMFLLPPSEIQATGEDLLIGLRVLAKGHI